MSLNNSFLRTVLSVDAIACGTMGATLVIFANSLAGVLGLSASFLTITGLVLLPLAIWIGLLARQSMPSRKAVWLLIAGNAVWVIDSFLLLFLGWVEPTALGTAFIVTQAILTGVFAELEYIGVRRSAVAAA
jgi:hypothetical protein